MKKSLVIAACGLACVASSALAQVGLGGGVVGTLGASGAASSIGGLGSGISTSTGIDAKANGSGIRADTAGAASAAAETPVVAGSAWGSAQSNAQMSGPDLVGTKDRVRDAKNGAKNDVKNKIDGLEERRDRLEERTDKKTDKTIDKI